MSGQHKYLLICNSSDGLIAQLNGVVVQLQLAKRLGLAPIVLLHGRSNMFGGPNPYFDASQGSNVWEYYLEPVGVSGAELDRLINLGEVVTLSTASELLRLFRWDPDSWFMNPYGYFRSVENTADGSYCADWWNSQREKARAFVSDGTLRFKSSITDSAEQFVRHNFSEKTLGVQMRGSDKFDFGVGPNLSRKVLPDEYFRHIDGYLNANPDCKRIFVATDQRQWLDVLKARYPDHILSASELSLGMDAQNQFNRTDNKAVRGLEVLIDVLLLARCSHLIKCHASVGEMALMLNPNLPFIDLNYATQPFVAKERALKPFAAQAIKSLCLFWKQRAESGHGLVEVAAMDGAEVIVRPRGRLLNTKSKVGEKAARPPLVSNRFVSNALDAVLLTLSKQCFAYTSRS